MSNYYELLKDPRWQKKRLEVLETANWKCESCDSGERTLHVHHMYYERGAKPWEYPANALRCLCEDCHFRIQDEQAEIARLISGLHVQDLGYVKGFAAALGVLARSRVPGMSIPVGDMSDDASPEDRGILMAYRLRAKEARPLIRDGRIYMSDLNAYLDARDGT